MTDDPAVQAEPVAHATPKRHGFARRHWLALTLATLIVLPAAGFALWVTSTLAYSYSSGWRAGYNQKISRKGWVCKTWEGELAQSSVPGVAPTIWPYSVRSDSVAHAIETLAGQPVELHYAAQGCALELLRRDRVLRRRRAEGRQLSAPLQRV